MPIMETMERNKRRDRRSYTPEFKSEIVDRCRAGDRTIAEVARDFDLTVSAARSIRTPIGHLSGTSQLPSAVTRMCLTNTSLVVDIDIQ